MWWLSGIHRDVMLYSKPARAAIWDYRILTEPVAGPSGGPLASGGVHAYSIKVEVEVRRLDAGVCHVLLGGRGEAAGDEKEAPVRGAGESQSLAPNSDAPEDAGSFLLLGLGKVRGSETGLGEREPSETPGAEGGGAEDNGLSVKIGVYGPHRLMPDATSTGTHAQQSSWACLYMCVY